MSATNDFWQNYLGSFQREWHFGGNNGGKIVVNATSRHAAVNSASFLLHDSLLGGAGTGITAGLNARYLSVRVSRVKDTSTLMDATTLIDLKAGTADIHSYIDGNGAKASFANGVIPFRSAGKFVLCVVNGVFKAGHIYYDRTGGPGVTIDTGDGTGDFFEMPEHVASRLTTRGENFDNGTYVFQKDSLYVWENRTGTPAWYLKGGASSASSAGGEFCIVREFGWDDAGPVSSVAMVPDDHVITRSCVEITEAYSVPMTSRPLVKVNWTNGGFKELMVVDSWGDIDECVIGTYNCDELQVKGSPSAGPGEIIVNGVGSPGETTGRGKAYVWYTKPLI